MKHKFTNEVLADIAVKEWARYFNNIPAKPFTKINSMSLVSVKQKRQLKNANKK